MFPNDLGENILKGPINSSFQRQERGYSIVVVENEGSEINEKRSEEKRRGEPK